MPVPSSSPSMSYPALGQYSVGNDLHARDKQQTLMHSGGMALPALALGGGLRPALGMTNNVHVLGNLLGTGISANLTTQATLGRPVEESSSPRRLRKVGESRAAKKISSSKDKEKDKSERAANAANTTTDRATPEASKKDKDATNCLSLALHGGSMILHKHDTVLLRPPDDENDEDESEGGGNGEPKQDSFIARIERIDRFGRVAAQTNPELKGEPAVYVSWFYRPEEVSGGRRVFHGEREVFVSDHRDWCHANSIEGSCRVLSLAEYQATQLIQPTDFFCRFFYSPTTRTFRPDEVPVYCLCNSPYNPDVFMVECGTCYDWFHPRCVRMTEEEVEHIQTFTCPSCKEDGGGGGKKRLRS
ncbi:chromatin remodeling protein EBS [Pseudoscourfieldia marina]